MSCQMSGHLDSVEGRKQTAVTHLAFARRLNCRKRHFGLIHKIKYIDTKDERAALNSSSFFKYKWKRCYMKFNVKYKKLTIIILSIVVVSLIITGVILSKLMKEAKAEIEANWFFEESLRTGEPVVLNDAFLVSTKDDKLRFIHEYNLYEVKGTMEQDFFGVVDITVDGRKISKISIKPNVQEGVLESYTENTISLEEQEIKEKNNSIPIYKVIDQEVYQIEWNEMVLGVSEVSMVLDHGIVSALIVENDVTPVDIRVIIKNGGSIFYEDLYVKKVSDGTLFHAKEYFANHNVLEIEIVDEQGMELCDATGQAIKEPYEGSFRIINTEQGFVLVNELSVETYLKYVVPSEMQRSFGHEALKAQAVCARTFAYSQMNNQSYAAYGANLDDSTAFQVYHSIGRYPETDAAVDETAGEVILCDDELITCYYYSTSPGVTNDMTAWESENDEYIACSGMEFSQGLNLAMESDFSKFINQEVACYDSISSFYRWDCVLDTSKIIEEEKGLLKNISVKERNEAGYIIALELEYENTIVVLRNENEIRSVLGAYQKELTLNNDQVRTDISMVPSACFEVSAVTDETITLHGGGFGHGIGMSQYGAKAMAEEGYSYIQIIDYYYENVVVKPL